jgi:hypothetical protein
MTLTRDRVPASPQASNGATVTQSSGTSLAQALSILAARLRARQNDIEEALFSHVSAAVPDQATCADPEYLLGRRAAISACVTFVLAALAQGEERMDPIPSEPLAHAHRAARHGVALDAILRRYYAAHQLFSEFVIEEGYELVPEHLRYATRLHASLLDMLVERISREYKSEIDRASRSPQQRITVRVQRLLAGQPVDLSKLRYDFDGGHVAMIATGPGAAQFVPRMEARFGRSLLSASPDVATIWLWIGGRATPTEIERVFDSSRPGNVSLTVGERASGLAGWRLTHSQAEDALRVALLTGQPFTRYTDVALVAPWVHDPPRARALVDFYLLSLFESATSVDSTLCTTLQAYFVAGRNATSAAHALGIHRRTMYARLERIDSRLGSLLRTHQAELELALRLFHLLGAGTGVQGAHNMPSRDM